MEALIEEMQRDPKTIHFSTAAPPNLIKEFGSKRVRATPISEGAFSGIAIGAACSGYRPIADWQMVTFSFVAMDQTTIRASVQKTGRLVIADEAGPTAGASAEIAAVITEDRETFSKMKAPLKRI